MVVDLDSKKKVLGIELLLPPTLRKEIKARAPSTKAIGLARPNKTSEPFW